MSLYNKENNIFNIYIKVFVHYPEVYNCTVINDRFDKYFDKYFKINELLNSKYEGKCYVTFKTAPHNENQMIVIDLEFTDKLDESINKDKIELEWKEFISVYFDKQINDIIINFISLNEI
jgi:hypothetical protein